MLALETESVLQAWALPIENISGIGGFVLALVANPLTSRVGREGSPWCSTSFVPPEWFRLSLIEDISEIKIEEKRLRRRLRAEVEVRERRRNHCWPNKRNRNETWGRPRELSGVRHDARYLYDAVEPSWAWRRCYSSSRLRPQRRW